MRRIALLHADRAVMEPFENRLRGAVCEELEIYNLLDEFLLNGQHTGGALAGDNLARLHCGLRSAELTGAELIVVTSAALTLRLDSVRPYFATPILGIDQPMIRHAAACGNKITVLATTRAEADDARIKLLREGVTANRTLAVSETVSLRAFEALIKKDMVSHDRLLKAAALSIKNQDAVVLAQASMAHLEREIQSICGCRVFSSPGLCIAQVKSSLETGDRRSCKIHACTVN